MFSVLNSVEDKFYSPISASGYLTPLQRKKLREKRKISISPEFTEDYATPKNSKKQKRNVKPQFKAPNKTVLFKNKQPKSILPELRCITSDLLVKRNSVSDPRDRKFFKSRSPQHLKKAKFSMPLTFSKKSLNFGNTAVHQNTASPLVRVKCNAQTDVLDRAMELTAEKNEQPSQQYYEDSSPNTLIGSSTSTTLLKETVKIAIKSENLLEDMENVSDCVPMNEGPVRLDCDVACEEKKNVFEKGIFDFDWPSDEDLLERQKRARSEAKQSKSTSEYDQESKENVEEARVTPPKLYPIFLKGKCSGKDPALKRPCLKKSPTFIKDSSVGGEQMYIDAGQKEIGAKVCPTCNMIYTIAQEEDEKLHSKYHETFLINLKFLGWKDEEVVGEYNDGRVILVKETDKHYKLKKVKDVLYIANRDLGFTTTSYPSKPNIMFFLFISNEKKVCGCLVAESIKSACPVVKGTDVDSGNQETIWEMGNWYASNNPVDAICGVNRIWVSKNFRRHKVASRMLDCLRHNFVFGHVVGLHELAFTDPSPDGRQFAASYTQTNNFLVYK